MHVKTIFSLLLSACLMACVGGRLPYTFETYSTTNTSYDEIKKAMKECGYKNFYNSSRDTAVGATRNPTPNETAERENCMIDKGFKWSKDVRYRGTCSIPKYEFLPACNIAPQ